MLVPNNHGVFLLKMLISRCEMGAPPVKETPIYLFMYMYTVEWMVHVSGKFCNVQKNNSMGSEPVFF